MMNNSRVNPMKVLVIDDSAFSRQTIRRILEKSDKIEVVGVAFNGQDAIQKILRFSPDAVTLDLEMPTMDGYTLLRWLMKEHPMPVIVVSSHKHRSTVFKAMELGAIDFVVKPTKRASEELAEIEEDLLTKVLSVSSMKVEKLKKNIELLDRTDVIPKVSTRLRKNIEIIAIGASTGGPPAIQSIITRFPADFPGAIVISQHMPGGFTKQFAERMNSISNLKVSEARAGQTVESGTVLICPGDKNMQLAKKDDRVTVTLREPTRLDRYVPSIDIMMKSVAHIYGKSAMGIVLTGMGNDGTKGISEIKKKGGMTIAESEESSVVFGMPKEAIRSGDADLVLSLKDIPYEIMKSLKPS